jgi:hypothetical protein
MGSEDTTVIDAAIVLEGYLNMSLRSACFTDETCGLWDTLSQLLKLQDFCSITFQIKGTLLYCSLFQLLK